MRSINEDYSLNYFRRNRTNVKDIPLLNQENQIIYPELYDNKFQEANIPYNKVEKKIFKEPNNFIKIHEIPFIKYPAKTTGRNGWYYDTNFHRNELLINAVESLERPMR